MEEMSWNVKIGEYLYCMQWAYICDCVQSLTQWKCGTFEAKLHIICLKVKNLSLPII
jgi:hypothetical protein